MSTVARLVVAGCQCTQLHPDASARRHLSQLTADLAARSPRWNGDDVWRPAVPRARASSMAAAVQAVHLCVEGVTPLDLGEPRPVPTCDREPLDLGAHDWAESLGDVVLAVPPGPADVYLLFAGRVLAPVCRDLHAFAEQRAATLRCATPLTGTAGSPFLIDHVLRLTDPSPDAPGWTPLPLVGDLEDADAPW